MGVKSTQRWPNFTLPVDEDGGSLSAVAGEDKSHFCVCLAHICHSLWTARLWELASFQDRSSGNTLYKENMKTYKLEGKVEKAVSLNQTT